MLDAVQHAARFAGFHGLREDEFHVALGVRVDVVGPGDGADLDRKDVGKAHAVIVAQEHELTVGLDKAPAIGHAAILAAFFEAEDGAVRCVIAEDSHVAGFVEMRDAALLEQPAIELAGGGQFDEFTRHDENQLAARLQVADALFDEEQEEVAACVEQFRFQAFFRVDRDILKTDVGRVADDAVELLAERVGEKVANQRAFGGDAWVDLDADAIGLTGLQFVEEGAVTSRWLQRPPLVCAQVEHEGHHIGRREDLAELFDVARCHSDQKPLPGWAR